MDKPITMVISETKQNLAETVNKSGLPIWLIRMIIKELYQEVNRLADKNEAEEKAKYLESLKEEN